MKPVAVVKPVVVDVHQLLLEDELDARDAVVRTTLGAAPFRDTLRGRVHFVWREPYGRLVNAGNRVVCAKDENRNIVVALVIAEFRKRLDVFSRRRRDSAVPARAFDKPGAHFARDLRREHFFACHVAREVHKAVGVGNADGGARKCRVDDVVRGVDRVREKPYRDAALVLGVDVESLLAVHHYKVGRPAAYPPDAAEKRFMNADERRHVRDVGEIGAEKRLEHVRHGLRAHRCVAFAPHEVLEKRLHRSHRESRARAVALDVAEDVEVAASSKRLGFEEVAAHRVQRMPVCGVEPSRGDDGANGQEASLYVRGEFKRLAVFVHPALDEHLDAVRRDDLPDALQQRLGGNGLGEVVAYGVVHLRRDAAHHVAEHESVHLAHHDVGDDGAERGRRLLQLRNGLFHRRSRDRDVADHPQLRAERKPYQLLVVDDKYLDLIVTICHISILESCTLQFLRTLPPFLSKL